jgi:hypothetical protein
MLNSAWPNPHRHGCGVPTVVAFDQAQTVVHLAGTGRAIPQQRGGVRKLCSTQPAVVDNPNMTQGRGVPQIDPALEAVIGAINALTERQDGGPGVVLTLGGLVVSGTIIPDWQWFDDVEHAARAAFVVHVGGCIDDEHGGWARLFRVLPSHWRTTTPSVGLRAR